jgi:hypothetical protein
MRHLGSLWAMRGSTRTIASIAAFALSSGLALGCGASQDASSGDAPGVSSTSVADDGSSTEATDASQSVPAVAEMSVFSRPRTDSDVLPSELHYLLEPRRCPPDRWECPGDAVANESRLLLSGLGVRETSIYAWPTTNGGVCVAPAEGGASCVLRFDRTQGRVSFLGVDPDEEGVGLPGTILGIVPDDVVSVDIELRGGQQRPAILDRNGFFDELPSGACPMGAFQSLTATYRDGTSKTVAIPWDNGPKQAPGSCEAP